MNRHNSALSDVLRAVPKFAVGGWAWVYNTTATIDQGAKTDRDAKVLKAKLSLNWRAPSRSSQLAPVPPLTPRTAPLWALSSYFFINPPTFPVRMLAGTFWYNAASPVSIPTTMATCRSICQRD